MYSNWISLKKLKTDKSIQSVNEIIELISSVRSFKNELNVSPGSFVDISIEKLDKKTNVILKKRNNN